MDHMIAQVAKHGLIDISVIARGDLQVDAHHTVEDIGICLGKCLAKALGDKKGINRFGSATVPMDESLVMAALDLSGRSLLSFQIPIKKKYLGTFETELVEEFFRAFASNAEATLHIMALSGKNTHHLIEAAFKAFGRALGEAVKRRSGISGVLSTKGKL